MVKQIQTLHPDYRECILDIDIFGKIVATPQQSLDELTTALYEEFKRSKPFPTLELRRYELSRPVSSDYEISYDEDMELQDNEELVELTNSVSSLPKIDFPDLTPLTEVRESFTYEEAVTVDIRQQIIDKYDLTTMEELFKPGIQQTENIVGSTEEDMSLYQTDSQIANIGHEQDEDDDGELAESVEPDAVEAENYDTNFHAASGEGFDESEADSEQLQDDDSAYYGEDTASDSEANADTPESDELDDASVYFEDGGSEQDTESDSGDEESAWGTEETTPEESEVQQETYDEGVNEQGSDADYGDETGAEVYGDETDESSYGDEVGEEGYGDEVGEEGYGDEVIDEGYEDEPQVDESLAEPLDFGNELSEDITDGLSGESFVVSQPQVTATSPPMSRPIVKPVEQVSVNKDSEPTDIRAFVRKYPRCEVSFALQYFTKKQIDDAVKLGRIIRKGNILR